MGKVQAALEVAGVEFIPENGGGPGERGATDHPKAVGPATDVVDAMDAAIEEHRTKRNR